MKPIYLGLTGYRRSGKSTLAEMLQNNHGYTRVHPADGMKAALFTYLTRAGIPEGEAYQMLYGMLKDKEHPMLPAPPRVLMEALGEAMGKAYPACAWTLGMELMRPALQGVQRIVVESVVYEEPALRALGGLIVKIHRPTSGNQGLPTDLAVDAIDPDVQVLNAGNLADLREDAARLHEWASSPRAGEQLDLFA